MSIIRVQHLAKTFGDFAAVAGISFEVQKGEVFAFLGPNGAGKTTTIKMLTTLLKPTGGSVELDGVDPQRQPNEVRRRFGIVFQDPSLDVELTAGENPLYPQQPENCYLFCGTAGSLAVLLIWLYYSAQIFFLGAEFTRQYALGFGSLRQRA